MQTCKMKTFTHGDMMRDGHVVRKFWLKWKHIVLILNCKSTFIRFMQIENSKLISKNMYPNSAKHKNKKMFCSIVWIPNGKTKFGWCYINKIAFGAFGFGKPLKKSRCEFGKGEKFTAHLYARRENTSYKKKQHQTATRPFSIVPFDVTPEFCIAKKMRR